MMDKELATDWSTDRIKQEIIKALSDYSRSWKNAETSDIEINDVSGYGGNKTFHVINNKISGNHDNDDEMKKEMCLHLIGKTNVSSNQTYAIPRLTSATTAFANANIGPKRIAESFDNFVINEWIPSKSPTKHEMNQNIAIALGELLARVHQIDTKWYEKHHRELVEKYPELSVVPKGSNFWYLTIRNWPLSFDKEDAQNMEWWLEKLSLFHQTFTENEVKPVTKAGQNIVTTHGDFHLGNILCIDSKENLTIGVEYQVANKGLQRLTIVDFEQSHVSHAIQDISYFFWTKPFKLKEDKLAFCKSYLKTMGYPCTSDDAFALALDAERVVLCTGFMTTIHHKFVNITNDMKRMDLNSYKIEKDLVVEKSFNDKEAANDIVENGLKSSAAYATVTKYFSNDQKKGISSMLHQIKSSEQQPKPFDKFLINWDGTIMPKESERWRGLVFGVDEAGDVILTNHINREQRLELSSEIMENLPVNGFVAPLAKPVPLVLKGDLVGKGVVRSPIKRGSHHGNQWITLSVDDAENADEVHFEKSGAIRFADMPDQAFDCVCGRHDNGTDINSYTFQNAKCHRFVRNNDDTISPFEDLDVILVSSKGIVKQHNKHDISTSATITKLIFDLPVGIGPSSSEVELDINKELNEKVTNYTTMLKLKSHPGKAIGFAAIAPDIQEYMKKYNIENKYKLVVCDENIAPQFTITSSSDFTYMKVDTGDRLLNTGSREESSVDGTMLVTAGISSVN